MKLEYNVLWVDDHLARLKTVKRDFTGINQDVGISVAFEDVDASMKPRDTPESYKKRITLDVAGKFNADKQYDLILVDLHFGPKDGDEELFNGSNIVELIRDSHSMYRPIVFYSSGDPETSDIAVTQLEETVKSNKLFGKSIFISTFDDLSIFILNLAKDMHKEEHKINHVRGLLMDQVSEFDAKIIQLIKNEGVWSIATEENAQKKVVAEFQRVAKMKFDTSEEVFKASENITYKELKEYIKSADHRTIDTFTRSKMLREILRSYDKDQSLGKTLSKAIQGADKGKILTDIRNLYAHETSDILDGKHHSPEKCKYIREECRKQIQNVLKIESVS